MLRVPRPSRRLLNGALVAVLASVTLFEGACFGPPTITCSAAPAVLAPADGMFHPVTVTVHAATSMIASPDSSPFTLTSVTSNDAITPADYPGFTPGTTYAPGTTSVSGAVRATVMPNTHGRLYRITFTATNPAGSASCSATVQVRPH